MAKSSLAKVEADKEKQEKDADETYKTAPDLFETTKL